MSKNTMLKNEKIDDVFKSIVNNIKTEIRTAQINAIRQYGNSFIKNVSNAIRLEYPGTTIGISSYMLKEYLPSEEEINMHLDL